MDTWSVWGGVYTVRAKALKNNELSEWMFFGGAQLSGKQ